ncbi:hypothetical protein LTR70_000264 [Exophiala xenobiotica]|nr:hypothetical protein LTR70_000264 [Exophiala xenobiotica]
MKVQLFSAAAMLAMACTVTAKPIADGTNTVPISWADAEAGTQSAERAEQGQADKRSVDQDLHARDPTKSGAEGSHLNTGLWGGKGQKEHEHDQAGKPSKRQASGGACEGAGSGCYGDVTHYDGGVGACGWNVNTKTEMVIAMPVGMMGALSNDNPYCGRSLTIKNPTTGTTAQAIVGDKCMGCQGQSIDLTDALFNAIAPGCDGRCHGYEWWFN